ncbi:STP1 protein [Plasmodium ovale]|uniref:STP1 protein n=1 Tax=Plasmodium ovale TaxID=36330 RepID=A0A1D3JBZ2_PLAOA|nr:STP1 protein [Plasmodium ovale]
MADHLEYTTLTHYIPIEVFYAMIESDIKKLIHTHGHKNCGLMHEKLCEEIKKVIFEKKNTVLNLMDKRGKKKWSDEWDSQRNGFFNKLFEEEGFINMCYPPKGKGNQNLQKLKSKHIQFCKEKDQRLLAIGKSREYSVCLEYNKWIIAETDSFTQEFLQNVSDYSHRTVKKYFTTKKHPGGHDPLLTYRNIKLDCEIYNPKSERYQKIPVENAPTNSIHPSKASDARQKSQGKGRKSIPGRDVGTEKKKSDVKIPSKTEPPASDSLTSSITNTNVDGTANDQHNNIKAKVIDSPIKAQGATGQPPKTTDTKAPSTQQLPEPTSAISPKDLSAAKVSNPPSSVIKGQDTDPDATPSTTSATSDTTHTKNVQSSLTPDVSLAQPQPPAVAADTDHYSKEPTPYPVRKSTDQGASLTSALDPGLAPSQVATSNSSASETSSTNTSIATSSTMTLTPGSSLAQDSHLLTPSTQTIVTTSIATPLTQTTTSVSVPPTITFSAISTNPITSIIKITSTKRDSREPNALSKTITNSIDLNSASPKNQDNVLPPNTGVQFPDVPSSATSAKLNDILLPVPSPGPPPGLHSGSSPGGPAPVLPASHVVVTKPDGNKIITLPKKTSEQSKDSTQVTSKSLPEGTQPSDKPSITLKKFPPLTIIIPTFVIILATVTLLFLLYKYTPIGLFLGRKKRRKKKDLRKIFVTPEEPTYEPPYKTMHTWDNHNLGKQIMENDIQMKLLEVKRYKQAIQKKKKKKKTTLIEMHMEVLEQNKNDEWELHKGDFLEICLRGFKNEENDNYSKLPNTELTVKSTKNDKIIEDIQKQEILWNNWIENHRKILEQWKEKEWFHILKNKWRNEQQKYKEKNNKLQENILNEQEKHSIVSQKDIWKQWISKQATLIDMFNKEDWFKSIVCVQNKEKDNYHINEYNNISVTSKTGLKNEKMNHEHCKSKNIIQKLMVQIHMMVLEECIKEDIIKHKELCIDNIIEDIHNQNNYDEKRNIPQCDTDDFSVPEYEEIHTSKNK